MSTQGQVIDLWGSFVEGVEMAGRAQELADQREASIWDRDFRERDLQSRETMHEEQLKTQKELLDTQIQSNEFMQGREITAQFEKLAEEYGFRWIEIGEQHRQRLVEMAQQYGIDAALTTLQGELAATRDKAQRNWQTKESALDRDLKGDLQLREIEHSKDLEQGRITADRSGYFPRQDGTGFEYGDPITMRGRKDIILTPPGTNIWENFAPDFLNNEPLEVPRNATVQEKESLRSENLRRARNRARRATIWKKTDFFNQFLYDKSQTPNALRGAVDVFSSDRQPQSPNLVRDPFLRPFTLRSQP